MPDNGPKRKRILVADDDDDIRLVLRVILERIGYEIVEASNGSEVLEMAERSQLDLILLDFAMPRLDGRQALKTLKSNPKTSRLPVVVISATRDETLAKQLQSMGASIYLVKPWSEGEIEAIVAHALSQSQVLPAGQDDDDGGDVVPDDAEEEARPPST